MNNALAGMTRACLLVGLCVVLASGNAAMASSGNSGQQATADSPTLLDLWFALQASGPVYAPYAYMLQRDTVSRQSARKATLLKQLNNLMWRLDAAGHSALANALHQWRRHIREADDFRTPGHWGPTALLSRTGDSIPVASIAAIGACQIPSWIEVWSSDGVKRIIWRPSMHLSTLLSKGGILRHADADHVSVVTPYGRIVQRGIAAWNYEDIPLSPGMRIVVPLPLGSQASDWIQKTLTTFWRIFCPVMPAGR